MIGVRERDVVHHKGGSTRLGAPRVTPRRGGRSVAHPLSYRAVILLAMYFSPHTFSPQPCWHCTHFLALIYQDTAAKCALPPGIRAMPERGCAFWEREVGADDEAGPPVSADVPRRLAATDQPVAVAWAP